MSITHEEAIDTLKWTLTRLQKLEKIENEIRKYNRYVSSSGYSEDSSAVKGRAFDRLFCIIVDENWRD